MPPIIPLIICTLFVLFLLRLERRQAPNVSRALWIPTTWLLVTFSKPLAIWFNMGGADMESGSPLDRFFLVSLAIVAILIMAKRHVKSSQLISQNIWVVIFAAYILVSILWSDFPFMSFKRWIREIVAIIMVSFVVTETKPQEAVISIFRKLIYIMIPYSLVLIKYYPHLGVIYANWSGMMMWTGVTLHKNTLCSFTSLSIFFLIWTFIRRRSGRDILVVPYQRYIEYFLLFLSIWLFMGPYHSITNSATSAATLFVGLLLMFFLFWMNKNKINISSIFFLVFCIFIILYGTIIPFAGGLIGLDLSSALNRDVSLTGRSDIWAALIPYVLDKPLNGYGFGGFWTDTMRETIKASNGHNGYLEIILSIGFIGLILFSAFILKNCKNAHKTLINHYNYDYGIFWICFLIMSLLHNMAESSMTSLSSQKVAVLMLLNATAISMHSDPDLDDASAT